MAQSKKFEIWLEERVSVARITGIWNLDTAKAFSQEIMSKCQPLIGSGDAWAHLALLEDWELGTPEIEHEIQALCDWMILNGMSHTANVFSPNGAKSFQLNRMLEHINISAIRCTFDKEDRARRWLAQSGFLHNE